MIRKRPVNTVIGLATGQPLNSELNYRSFEQCEHLFGIKIGPNENIVEKIDPLLIQTIVPHESHLSSNMTAPTKNTATVCI